MAMMMTSSLVINWISIIMLAILLVVYLSNMRKFKSGFSIGLAIFAGLLLLQNILQVYFYTTSMVMYTGVESQLLTFGIVQIAAYAVILWITLRN